MAVGDEKTFFCTLPAYPDSENRKTNKIDILLDENGNANLQVHANLRTKDYEDILFRLKSANNKEENDILAGLLKVHKPQISNFRKTEKRNELPCLDLFYTVQCEDFAPKTGSRMYIPVNPVLTSLKRYFPASSRRFDIVFKSNILQSDTITIRIPKGYELESKPESVDISSEYGTFKSDFKQHDNLLKYIQILEIRQGRYEASQYKEMKNFFYKIESLQNRKIGLKKKSQQ